MKAWIVGMALLLTPIPCAAAQDAAAQRSAVAEARARRPVDRAQLSQRLYELIDTLSVAGESAQALPLAQEALALWPGPSVERGQALIAMVILLNQLERFAEAEPYAREVLALRARLLGAGHVRTVNAQRELARAIAGQGRLRDAEAIYRTVYMLRQKLADPASLAEAAGDVGDNLSAQGRKADAVPFFREALAHAERADPTGEDTQWRRFALAAVLIDLSQDAEAEPLLAKALKALDDGSDAKADALRDYIYLHAFSLDRLGRDVEAEPLYRRVLKRELADPERGPHHPHTAATLSNLGFSLLDLGRPQEALKLLRDAIAIYGQAGTRGDSHAQALEGAAIALSRLDARANFAEIEALLARALEQRGGVADGNTAVARNREFLAAAYSSVGRRDEAEAMQREAIALLRKSVGEGHPRFLQAMHDHVFMLLDYGRYDDAERAARALLAAHQRVGDPRATARAAVTLSSVLRQRENYPASGAISRYALTLLEGAGAGESTDAANALSGIAELEQQAGRLAEAEALYRRVLAIWEKNVAPTNRNRGAALRHLAANLMLQHRYAAAEPVLRAALEVFLVSDGVGGNSAWVNVALAEVLGKLGRADEARERFRDAIAVYARDFGATHSGLVDPLMGYGRFALDRAEPRLALAQARRAAPIVLARAGRAGVDADARREFERSRRVFKLQVTAAWQVANGRGSPSPAK